MQVTCLRIRVRVRVRVRVKVKVKVRVRVRVSTVPSGPGNMAVPGESVRTFRVATAF
jgi:hypothetical protein